MDDKNPQSRVTQTGEALREGVESAASTTAAATGEGEEALGERGEAVQQAARQAWSQAGDVADDMLATGRQAAQVVSRQFDEQPFMTVVVGFVLGYIAGALIHRRR